MSHPPAVRPIVYLPSYSSQDALALPSVFPAPVFCFHSAPLARHGRNTASFASFKAQVPGPIFKRNDRTVRTAHRAGVSRGSLQPIAGPKLGSPSAAVAVQLCRAVPWAGRLHCGSPSSLSPRSGAQTPRSHGWRRKMGTVEEPEHPEFVFFAAQLCTTL